MVRRFLLVAALAGSLGVHGVIAGLHPPRAPAPIGGDMAGEVALGTSFADLSAGVMESTRAEGETEAAPVEALENVEPASSPVAEAGSSETPPPTTASPTRVPVTSASRPTKSNPSPATPAADTAPIVAVTRDVPVMSPAAAISTTSRLQGTPPADIGDVAVLSPVEAPPVNERSEPAKSARTAEASVAKAVQPTQTLAPAEARDAIQLTKSLRPVPRPSPRREVVREVTAPAAAPARRGNTSVNAARGQSSGSATGQQAETNRAQQTSARRAGQAEINSYNASVANRVTRAAGRLRAGGNRGTVRVSVTISAGGGLAGVSVISSSGNSRADALAVEAVRRAAPFGAPPQGSTRLRVTVLIQR